jgi:RNA polymerase sigma-70 factor (ECF subfamily)
VEGRPRDDGELIALAQDGDVRAYERLVERYRDLAFRSAYLIVRDAADAEDAAQDAFVKAYYALARFRAGEPFRPWILRIVANEARNRRRSAGRRERLALRVVEGGGPGDAAPSPDAAVLADEARRVLVAALDALPDRERDVIAHRYLLDLSEAETAHALGIRPGTVKSRLSRGLARLRGLMPHVEDRAEEVDAGA